MSAEDEKGASFQLREIRELEGFRLCEELQKEVWGFEDRSVVPLPMMVLAQRFGGVVVGAYSKAGELIGFVYGFPALKEGKLIHYSHMLAVKEDYRGLGIGRLLKLEQRRMALEKGMDLIVWAFDPLERANAKLNITSLGVIIREYEVDFYGPGTSILHQGLPTDRLLAEWHLTTPRVEEHINKKKGSTHLAEKPAMKAVDLVRNRQGLPQPATSQLDLTAPGLLVAIPDNIQSLKARDLALARKWLFAVREALTRCFEAVYTITEFLDPKTQEGASYYYLERGHSL
ncbi:GNAT family N-acetyltransferase [bacterium (candidate division B38) B3_B38]|nr:MAG: GNAT family N-acetyltransferase [bacterium (candidate division B38) B3_B38]